MTEKNIFVCKFQFIFYVKTAHTPPPPPPPTPGGGGGAVHTMFLGSVQLHYELSISSSFSKKCLAPARLADTGFSKIIISLKLRQCVAMAHESLVSSNLIGYLRVRILPNYIIGFISFFVVVFRMIIMKIWSESKTFFVLRLVVH